LEVPSSRSWYGNAKPAEARARLDPASFLVKPLRSAGINAALVMAFERSERTNELKQQVFKLEERLRSRRIVLAAVLQVMHSHARG